MSKNIPISNIFLLIFIRVYNKDVKGIYNAYPQNCEKTIKNQTIVRRLCKEIKFV